MSAATTRADRSPRDRILLLGDGSIAVESYFDQFHRWLDLESAAEAQELAERRQLRTRKTAEQGGEALLDLAIQDHRSGLGGRHLFTFVKRNRTLSLPWNRLRVGSPVVITSLDNADESPRSGVVSARKIDSIQVAVDHWISGDRFDLDLSTDEVSRNRERASLQNVAAARGRLGELRQIALGDRDPGYAKRRQPRFGEVRPLAGVDGLNPSQRAAIEFALSAEDIAIIHGPPGTGKTTSVAAFIRQACAPRRKGAGLRPQQYGGRQSAGTVGRLRAVGRAHRASGAVKDALRSHTLDALVETHDNMRLVKDLLRRPRICTARRIGIPAPNRPAAPS